MHGVSPAADILINDVLIVRTGGIYIYTHTHTHTNIFSEFTHTKLQAN